MTDRPATPTIANVPTPAKNSASGIAARRGVSTIASTRPSTPPTNTGNFASLMRNAYSASGTASRPLLRPSSSARSPVAVSEYSGWPVTAKSTPAHTSGPIAASTA